MNRISFRQGMLLGFMLIVLLLGGVAIQSWLVVERLVDQSRRSSEQAIQLTAAIQELGERTVDIERSARQYLVLDNPVFRQRFDEHLAQSLAVVERLDGMASCAAYACETGMTGSESPHTTIDGTRAERYSLSWALTR